MTDHDDNSEVGRWSVESRTCHVVCMARFSKSISKLATHPPFEPSRPRRTIHLEPTIGKSTYAQQTFMVIWTVWYNVVCSISIVNFPISSEVDIVCERTWPRSNFHPLFSRIEIDAVCNPREWLCRLRSGRIWSRGSFSSWSLCFLADRNLLQNEERAKEVSNRIRVGSPYEYRRSSVSAERKLSPEVPLYFRQSWSRSTSEDLGCRWSTSSRKSSSHRWSRILI